MMPFPYEPLTADLALPRPSSLLQTAHLTLSSPSLSSLSSRSPSFLSRFPAEILDLILPHLSPATLVALQQTCKLGLLTVRGNRLWASFLSPDNVESLLPALRAAAVTRAPITLAQLANAVEWPWCDECASAAVGELDRPSTSSSSTSSNLAAFVCLLTGRRLCRSCLRGVPWWWTGEEGGPRQLLHGSGRGDVVTAWEAACWWGISVAWLRRKGLTVRTVRGFYGSEKVPEGGREVVLLPIVSEVLGIPTQGASRYGEVKKRVQIVLERRRRWDGLGEDVAERNYWESKVGKLSAGGDRYIPNKGYYDAIQGFPDLNNSSREGKGRGREMDTREERRQKYFHPVSVIYSDDRRLRYTRNPKVVEAIRSSTVIRLPLKTSLLLSPFPQPDPHITGILAIFTKTAQPHQGAQSVEKHGVPEKQTESLKEVKEWIWPLHCTKCHSAFIHQCPCSLRPIPVPPNAIGIQLAVTPLSPQDNGGIEKKWLEYMEERRRRI